MPSLVKARGLNTFRNELDVGEGTLEKALNVVIDRDNIIEPRRGLGQFGELGVASDRSKQVHTYKNRILSHYDSKLAFDSTGEGEFLDFDGSYTEPQSGTRMKSAESNGNFYFTTNQGIFKISANSSSSFNTNPGYIIKAGGPLALDGTANLDFSQAGFFTANSSVAYRVVWGYTDANENLILGEPSSRIVLDNPTASSAIVDLQFSIPDEVMSESYIYQIYRSALVPIGQVPSDELYLVLEESVTSAEITAGLVSTVDLTPDDFRRNGALLYTNPQSGQGIEQANAKPPLCTDLTLYKNHLFYANTKSLDSLQLALLSVDTLVSGVSTLTFSNGIDPASVYTFIGVPQITDIQFNNSATTNDGGYFLINSANNDRKYLFWADKTGTTPEPFDLDTAGRILVRVDISTGIGPADEVANAFGTAMNLTGDFNVPITLTDTIVVTNANNGPSDAPSDSLLNPLNLVSIAVTQSGEGEDLLNQEVLLSGNISVASAIDETARSLVRVINADPDSKLNAIYISGPTDVPGLILLQGKELNANPVFIIADSVGTGGEFNPSIPISGTSVITIAEVNPNRVYYSKFQQPESVPIVNFFDIGPKDQEIKRVIGLRDSLFILKDDGIYRLTGENGQFTVNLFDSSATILATDSAAVLNNQIFMLSTQGVIRVSDTGVDVMSRDIEDQIRGIANAKFNYKPYTFGVGYEEDRAYILWTVSRTTDTVATQAYRFNVFTNTWTNWNVPATCGIVNMFNNKLYTGDASQNILRQERKNNERQDYADLELFRFIANNAFEGLNLTISSTIGINAGDMIVQEQYVTISQFNKILTMLDSDISIDETDFSSSLNMVAGDNLSNRVQSLVAKLNANPNTQETYTFSGTIDPEQIQIEFNVIIQTLNIDDGVFRTNYPESTGNVRFEVPIQAVIKNTSDITLAFPVPLIIGDISVFKSFETDIIWNPFIGGDPSIYKQFYEGTVMVEDNLFRTAQIGYKSDISQNYEFIDFDGLVNGVWGGYFWGEQNWGGGGNQTPLRTLIPLNKQRCRYIYCRFKHTNAYEKYGILGIYFNVRPFSDRAYR